MKIVEKALYYSLICLRFIAVFFIILALGVNALLFPKKEKDQEDDAF
jgi:hypothetical protein